MTTDTTPAPQVRIQILGGDGEWRTPDRVPAALAAVFRAAAQDITGWPAEYTAGDLRALRDALDELDAVIGREIRKAA